MKSQEYEQINNMEKTPWDTFLNKTHALDFVRRIRDEGWMDDLLYAACIDYVEQKGDDEDRDILTLGLPSRAYRCLRLSDIHTVKQLRYMLLGNKHPKSHKDFFDIRNMGIITAKQVIEIAVNKEVIKKDEIGLNHNERNEEKWDECQASFQSCRKIG